MRYIDLATWPRRKHYEYFSTLDYPYFNVCANVDVTGMYARMKAEGVSFFQACLYVTTRAANETPEFRYRIRPAGVVEHAAVHPSFTLMTAQDLFRFCRVTYTPDFRAFVGDATRQMAADQTTVSLADEPGADDLLFMTCLPWVSFTSVAHPVNLGPRGDSVPRIAWGKFFEQGARRQMPLSVMAHHGLVDGVHVGQYFARVQALIDELGS